MFSLVVNSPHGMMITQFKHSVASDSGIGPFDFVIFPFLSFRLSYPFPPLFITQHNKTRENKAEKYNMREEKIHEMDSSYIMLQQQQL